MPHSEECKSATAHLEKRWGYCIGGCVMVRDDAPELFDLLGKTKDVTRRHMPTFEVTEDHLKLAQRMYWQWDDGAYDGAPAVGLKRPYGNSDVSGDIAEILGWDYPDEDEVSASEFDRRVDDIYERAMKIHREMSTVLQIATFTQTWEPGTYRRIRPYDTRSWERVDA